MRASRLRLVLLPGALIALAACSEPVQVAQDETQERVEEVQEAVQEAVTPAVVSPQAGVAAAVVPAIVAVQEAVQDAIPEAVAAPPAPSIDPRAVDLIIRWEVTSEKRYTKALQWPIWPGGISGVTWGIGYDGGHQTRQTIARDWAGHAGLQRLLRTSGVVGTPAAPLARGMRDVLTPFGYGRQVFVDASLPVYLASTRRAYGAGGFDLLPSTAQGALTSNTYNRGPAMVGERNREKRVIRDECIPAGSTACIARELRASCRLWRDTPNGPGLCARREDEATLAETP